jgi:glycerol transport system substrate-binding protein
VVEERGQAVTGEKTPQVAMDNLAEEMDNVMARLQRAGMAHCAPKLNPKSDPSKWLSSEHAPWKKLANENQRAKPSPMTSCCRRGRKGACANCC